jgi:hypothetical protein
LPHQDAAAGRVGTIAIGEVSASVLIALWPAHVNMAELTSLNFTYHHLRFVIIDLFPKIGPSTKVPFYSMEICCGVTHIVVESRNRVAFSG